MMLHGGTVTGTGTITNVNAGSIFESRFNRGAVRVENALVLDESITIDSPNGDNLLQMAGDISGSGGLTADRQRRPRNCSGATPTPEPRSIRRTAASPSARGPRSTAGDPPSGPTTNLVVNSAAGAGFRVGGERAASRPADLDVLLPLGTPSGGFL